MFKFYKSRIDRFLKENQEFKIVTNNSKKFLTINKWVSEPKILEMLEILWIDKIKLSFHDTVHPTISDPGAYFSYSSEGTESEKYWNMTLGNHGCSDGIFKISAKTLCQQIASLTKKEELDSIQITDVAFFSNYKIKTIDESQKKDKEVLQMHVEMTPVETINRITSRDSHQIWKSSCEIVSKLQNSDFIRQLLPHIDSIKTATKGVELGGALAPNSRFLNGAIKTLEFYRDSDNCPCNLYGIHECMNPNTEVEKGYLAIDRITRIDDKWVSFYEAYCIKCGQKFKIEEGEGHYLWWDWKKMN